MAVLPDADRFALWAEFQRRNTDTLGGLTKTDLRDAVNAIDSWIDGNASSFNVSIPQPARNALTAKQKALLFMYCVTRRFEVA